MVSSQGDLTVEIDHEEWLRVASVLHIADRHEADVAGMVVLDCDGRRRRWAVTRGDALAVVDGDSDDRSYRLLVSPRIVMSGLRDSDRSGSARLVAHDPGDPEGWVGLHGSHVRLEVAADTRQGLDLDWWLERHRTTPAAEATIDAEVLGEFFESARRHPSPPDEDDGTPPPLFFLHVHTGGLAIRWSMPGLGFTAYELPGTGHGEATQPVDPDALLDAIAGLSGPVRVTVPHEPHGPVGILAEGRTSLLIPTDLSIERLRPTVEDVLARVFGPEVRPCDDAGRYVLSTSSTPILARLVEDRPERLEVAAVVVEDVPEDPALLAELNDFNAELGFARAFLADRRVVVQSDLVATTLDPEEVAAAYFRVADVAQRLGPMVEVMFGGRLRATAHADERWAAYLATIITAETSPGTMTPLTGPDAVASLPYPAVAFLLSAWNPFGRRRPVGENEEAHRQLAADLVGLDAGFHRATGSSPEGHHVEDGFVVWGLDLATAREVGRHYRQEVIFELTNDELRVVECHGERVERGQRKVA